MNDINIGDIIKAKHIQAGERFLQVEEVIKVEKSKNKELIGKNIYRCSIINHDDLQCLEIKNDDILNVYKNSQINITMTKEMYNDYGFFIGIDLAKEIEINSRKVSE